jgi:tetratricopeptide (TPR) repeat protein
MPISIKKFVIKNLFLFFIFITFISCQRESQDSDNLITSSYENYQYLNLSDTARYVGMEACRQCHENIYQTFIHTGMGKSWKDALKNNSASREFPGKIKDNKNLLEYHIHLNDSQRLCLTEISVSPFISHRSSYVASFIVGSGQHTNSHLLWMNGYLHQMPFTWYAQKKIWDFPPGFEVINSRFSRQIGHECITCHNAYPQPFAGSENKYRKIPLGIDCERCHGPGSIHVALKKQGIWVDTSKQIDYSIVNPSKLPIDRQMDICQRCHLQGNAVLTEGKSFYDFKPGMNLSDVMTVFLPRFSDSKEHFIMASHADRLKQSKCFIHSNKNLKQYALKPYRNGMTCITCHNPHVSVTQTRTDYFNEKCLKCHSPVKTTNVFCKKNNINEKSDCISCHMPKSTSTDIPHVTIHDHFIRKPENKKNISEIKKFLALVSVNNPNPDSITRAYGFMQQYEKFENRSEYLDSAFRLLSYASKNELFKKFHPLVYYYYLKKEFIRITEITETIGILNVYELLKNINFSNRDAWTAYRIGEAYTQTKDYKNGLLFLRKAHELAPLIPSFHAKYAYALVLNEKPGDALEEYKKLAKENPLYAEAFTNIGFIMLGMKNMKESKRNLEKSIKLNPNDDMVLLNMAAWFTSVNQKDSAKLFIQHLLKLNPRHDKAKAVWNYLNKN